MDKIGDWVQLVTAVTTLVAVIKGVTIAREVQKQTNGMHTQLMQMTRMEGQAEGKATERQAEAVRRDDAGERPIGGKPT